MILAGIIILISFYELLGILLIIYSITEIVNYVYFNTHKKKFSTVFEDEDNNIKPNNNKKIGKIKKEIKEKEAIDAVIEK